MRYLPPKSRLTLNEVHVACSEKTELFITATRISNPTLSSNFLIICRPTSLTDCYEPSLTTVDIVNFRVSTEREKQRALVENSEKLLHHLAHVSHS
jgi:hypothetical protein